MAPDAAERLLASLRPHVRDERVLVAMARAPRALFVPEPLRHRAYENRPLPIGGGQTISQPLVVARMADLLELRRGDRVLDVGSGSGWHAAVLANLGARVISIERDAELSRTAADAVRAAGVRGVELRVGDGFEGLPEAGPYDAINVAAAAPPEALAVLEGQLADGGRLVAPLEDGGQRLVLVTRRAWRFERESLEPVRFVPLVPGLAR